MDIEIINKNLLLDMHGFSAKAPDKDYSGTAFKLMDKMWRIVKSDNLKNKGLNIWVYEADDTVFAGIELLEPSGPGTELEQKIVSVNKYAYYKHIGPYKLIRQAGLMMKDALKNKGLQVIDPYIEIYGHWTNDESQLETELLMGLE